MNNLSHVTKFALSSGNVGSAATASTAARFLPFHVPFIEEDDIQAVTDVLRSDWITTGPKVKQFEQNFEKFTQARHAVAVNSGTAALHVALRAVGIKEGDEVLVPTMTFAATAEVVVYLRAKPVLVDSSAEHFNIDPDQVERNLTARTKAIVPVHFAGHPCEMDRLLEIARKFNLKVIEDAAHALPARYHDRMVGTIGDITCFSFYATKTITTGEGGMATTANEKYAESMRLLSLHGISKDAWMRYSATGSWRYQILEAGYKYNLTDLQAALGLVQLGKCEAMWRRRVAIAQRYSEALASFDGFQVPVVQTNIQHAWHLFVILVDPDILWISRDQVIEELRQRGIGTSVHFIPLHLHPYYQQTWGYRPGQFPHAEHHFRQCLSLPIYPRMSDADADYVIENLKDIAAKFRR
jgi:UDP-4-amino-4,6-dideoxy-N-acetyl-beta-L-altrosamine transaminase